MIKEKVKEIIDVLRVYKYIWTYSTFSSPLKLDSNTPQKGKAIVLCNGPSLKNNLPELPTGEDYMVVNYFGLDENFLRLKPKYYCLADGMFFLPYEGNKYKERIDALRDLFNNPHVVNWDLTIFVPSNQKKRFDYRFNLTNPKIKVTPVNTIDVQTDKIRHNYYIKQWACPSPQTVANLAIFVLINLGYQQIDLYGVDHTFIEGLCVDDNNVVCHMFRHYYNDEMKLVPAEDCFGNRPTLSSELSTLVTIFRSHEKLEAYSKAVGCTIVNMTKGSMIDSYKRGYLK